MSDVPVLETERLVMRGWREDDLDRYVPIASHPEVYSALGRTSEPTLHDVWSEIAFWAGHWELKGFGHWLVEKRDTGELVGRVGLLRPPEWPDLEVGWTIGREHWGNGYAGEAARASCEWAHEELGAEHIVSLIVPANTRSVRVAEKLGETVEGSFQHAGFEHRIYGADLPLGSAA